jgi:hypothetical protein
VEVRGRRGATPMELIVSDSFVIAVRVIGRAAALLR